MRGALGSGRCRRTLLILGFALPACSPAADPPPAPPPVAESAPAPSAPSSPATPELLPLPKILGSEDFVRETRAALVLLGEASRDAAELIAEHVREITPWGYSGTRTESGQVLIAERTLHAPGYSPDAQLVWYAGVLVHEAMHVLEGAAGHRQDWGAMTPEQRNECERGPRAAQAAVLGELSQRFEGKLHREVVWQREYCLGQNESETPPEYCYSNTRDW